MLHKKIILTVWTIVVIFFGLSVSSYSQTIGLEFGSSLISDRILFNDKALNCHPRPFTYIGLNYQTKGITTRLTYTFNLHIITIGSNLNLFTLNKNERNKIHKRKIYRRSKKK